MSRGARGGGRALLLAGPCVLAFFSGGFFDEARLWGGLVAWALVVVGAVTAPRRGGAGRGGGDGARGRRTGVPLGGGTDARRAGWAAAAALAGLCAWTALSRRLGAAVRAGARGRSSAWCSTSARCSPGCSCCRPCRGRWSRRSPPAPSS